MGTSSNENVVVADPRKAQLSAMLLPPPSTGAPAGLREISLEERKPALLYVPGGYTSNKPMPLVVMLHGAGGTARHSVDLVRRHADRVGFIVLAPTSHAYSWDIIAGRAYGPDVASIGEALSRVSREYALDSRRIAIAGFSDGASYALSLGLANGRLFSRVIAFSPGFFAPPRLEGSPKIFISHGVQDQVLPIERCSRRIIPQLKAAELDVDYREFPGGHTVPEEFATIAFSAVTSDDS